MTNLFNNMEFSQQSGNYLDEMFGLSADVLAADQDRDGSILDLNLDGDFKLHQSGSESLEDLLLQSPQGDSFGEDWMETVDFKMLLDGSTSVTATKQQCSPLEVKYTQLPAQEEPRKEGLKQSAFELLKALLTGSQPLKTDISLHKQEQYTPPTTPPAVASPVAEVPNLDLLDNLTPTESVYLDFSNTLENNVSFDMLLDDGTAQANPFESLIQPEVALDNGDLVEIKPSTDGPMIASIELLDTISSLSPSSVQTNTIGIHTSDVVSISDDNSSMLSSEPSSPFSTVDASQFSDSDYSPSSYKTSHVSNKDNVKSSKVKKEKARPTPYDSDYDTIGDKKVRKKVQNKNAATRYRVKKRMEKETLQEQEVHLSDKNKELKEKVESLTREIKYMKELMNEINKAKQRKI